MLFIGHESRWSLWYCVWLRVAVSRCFDQSNLASVGGCRSVLLSFDSCLSPLELSRHIQTADNAFFASGVATHRTLVEA
jgi:hypothetical protein